MVLISPIEECSPLSGSNGLAIGSEVYNISFLLGELFSLPEKDRRNEMADGNRDRANVCRR